jgi:hypothetical protein
MLLKPQMTSFGFSKCKYQSDSAIQNNESALDDGAILYCPRCAETALSAKSNVGRSNLRSHPKITRETPAQILLGLFQCLARCFATCQSLSRDFRGPARSFDVVRIPGNGDYREHAQLEIRAERENRPSRGPWGAAT